MQGPRAQSVPEGLVAACVATTLTLVYSAPTPGAGSRYVDGRVAHEARVLSAVPASDALAAAGGRGTGETVLKATLSSLTLAGFADPRAAGYLAPLARAALRGERSARVLAGLGHGDVAPFVRALEAAGEEGPLTGALRVALGAGHDATLRDAMRFSAQRDALAREYARDFEVTRASLSALARGFRPGCAGPGLPRGPSRGARP